MRHLHISNFTLVTLQLSEDGLGEEPSEDDTLKLELWGQPTKELDGLWKGSVCYHCPYESTSPYEWMTQIYHMPYTPAQLKCGLGLRTIVVII
jgi:hypothetical protein